MIVVSENVGGNLHSVAEWCNKYKLGKYLLQADYTGGNGSVVLLVMSEAEHAFYEKQMKTVHRIPWTMEDFK